MLEKISFGNEREITSEMGMGLENALRDAKRVDKQIAKTLTHSSSYFSRIPLLKNLVTNLKTSKPLASLEYELRSALNNSLTSLAKVGKKARNEKERISQLNEIYGIALKEKWGADDFIEFIEANTNLDYTITLDSEQFDMKDLLAEVDARLNPHKRKEKQKEYLDWFKQHINLGEQYLEAMKTLCLVGCEWIEGMSRSYFDLTQLRGGMEEIRKTLQNLGKGGTASLTSQKALRQYGTAYIKGMRSLMNGYRKMCALKESGSAEFKTSLKQLQLELNSPHVKGNLSKNYFSQERLIINPVYSKEKKKK